MAANRIRRAAGAVLLTVLAAALALPVVRSREQGPLTDSARSQAPGKFITLSHGQVHYRLSGPEQGQPVVLVHGFSVPSYVFDKTSADLAAAGFRVLTFDLYGRGWSDRPDTVYDRDLFANQVLELLDKLRIAKADILGLSMGGAVTGRFVAQHPERVRSVVLIAPVTNAKDISIVAWPGVGEWYAKSFFLPSLAENQYGDFAHPENLPDWGAKFKTQMAYDGFGRAILSTVRNVISRSSMPDFERIGKQSTPVMLLWGDHDQTLSYTAHEDVQRAIPQVKFMPLPGMGHLPVVENAAQIHPAIISFLRQPG